MTAGFPPIDSYGFLSDAPTAALAAPDGAVEWFCGPPSDGGSVFARLAQCGRNTDRTLWSVLSLNIR